MPMRTWSDTRRRPFVLPGWVGSFQKGLATCTAFGSKSYAGGDGRIAKESLMRGPCVDLVARGSIWLWSDLETSLFVETRSGED
jgi:hypothetical protein